MGRPGIRAKYGRAAAAAVMLLAVAVLPADAQATVTFGTEHAYLADSGVVQSRIADVTNDGKPDVVTLNGTPSFTSSKNLSVLAGAGDGTFAAPVNSSLGGSFGNAFDLADLNGDHLPDALVNSNSSLLFLSNGGSGAFAAPSTTTAGSSTYGIAVGDLNGDQKPDVVVADHNNSVIDVLIGGGNGAFNAAVSYPAGTGANAVALADVNGDHKLDVAVADDSTDNVSVLLGKGDGTFDAQKLNALPAGSLAKAVAVADLNEDGKPDLVIADRNTAKISVLIGNGDGTFQPHAEYTPGPTAPVTLAVADFDSDGHADVAVGGGSSGVAIMRGAGDGTLTLGTTLTVTSATGGNVPGDLEAADLDGDGLPDLVVTMNTRAYAYVYLNTSNVISVAPTNHDFGTVPVSTPSATFDVTVTLPHGGVFTVNSATTSDPQFTATLPSPCSSVTTCTVRTRVTPTATGPQSATLTIDSDQGRRTVALTATGGAAGPGVTLNPTDHDFGNVTTGQTSSPFDFTLTNNGPGNLTVSGVSTDDPTDFDATLIGGCTNVAPSGTCTVRVTGHPADLGGYATLSIASNASGTPTTALLHVFGQHQPINQAKPTISGTVAIGQTLTAGDGSWTAMTALTYTYRWVRCDQAGGNCNAIDGAIAKTYTVTKDDGGHALRVEVTAHDTASRQTSALSDPTAAVASMPGPQNLSKPTIAGQPTVGHALTVSNGTWAGNGGFSYTYRWRLCDAQGGSCADWLAGQTGATLTVIGDYAGHTAQAAVTAHDDYGDTEMMSDPTAPIGIDEASVTTSTAALDFGTLQAADASDKRTVDVYNRGNADTTIAPVLFTDFDELTANSPAGFTQASTYSWPGTFYADVSNCASTNETNSWHQPVYRLPAHGTCSVQVYAAPERKDAGTSVHMTLELNPGNSGSAPFDPPSVSLKVAVAPMSLDATPSPLRFGQVQPGVPRTAMLTLHSPRHLAKLWVLGGPVGGNARVAMDPGTCPSDILPGSTQVTLDPGQTCTVAVTYTAPAQGTHQPSKLGLYYQVGSYDGGPTGNPDQVIDLDAASVKRTVLSISNTATVAHVAMSCAFSAACHGSAAVYATRAAAGHVRAAGTAAAPVVTGARVLIGKAQYRIAAHHRGRVTIKLNATGRKLLKQNATLPVVVAIKQRAGTKKIDTEGDFALRGGSAKHR